MALYADPSVFEEKEANEIGLRKYLDVRIMESNYHLEIINVSSIIENYRITESVHIIGCVFIDDRERAILVVDIRDNIKRNEGEIANIVVANVAIGNNTLPMGFIVRKVGDFYHKLIEGK